MSNARYYQYLRGLTADFKTNAKRYWSFLKCVTNRSSISPVLRAPDSNTITDDQGRAELLNDAFARKFTQLNVTALPNAPAYDVDSLPRLVVSEASVRAALKSVPANKACGPDDISVRIIVECADELVVPITKLCNASISTGVFPDRWKQANIIPSTKKGIRRIRLTTGLCPCYLSSERYSSAQYTSNCINASHRPFVTGSTVLSRGGLA